MVFKLNFLALETMDSGEEPGGRFLFLQFSGVSLRLGFLVFLSGILLFMAFLYPANMIPEMAEQESWENGLE